MRDLCEDAGCWVFSVEDGQAALIWLVSGPTPALILLYLVMPAQSRWQVARRIRPLPRFRAVPVVVVSGVPPSRSARTGRWRRSSTRCRPRSPPDHFRD